MDLSALEAAAERIREGTIAPHTRNVYGYTTNALLVWLLTHKRHLVTRQLLEKCVTRIGEDEILRPTTDLPEVVDAFLSCDEHDDPIVFDKFMAAHFATWLMTLSEEGGYRPSFSCYKKHRAALMSLYRAYKKLVPEFFKSELKHYYRGLRRKEIRATVDGVRSSKAGKEGMPFDLYKFIASHMSSEPSSEFVFARTFMVLCWNLMARAESALGIRLHQLKFVEDSLCIYYAHTKNDQFGENLQDPEMPEVCPLLSLGVYWLCFRIEPGRTKLFPGGSQYDRARLLMSRCFDSRNVRAELVRRGIDANDLGTHSFRKGASSYATSGSTGGPSAAAVYVRAGWSLGGVQDTYLRYESAGDMHVGRTVCGLPDDRPEFALLPPRFTAGHTAIVARAIDSCFGAVPSSLRLVCEYALASVFYHRDYLRRVVPASDPLMSTLPFTNGVSSVTQLAKHVVCALPTSKDGLRATGVPPYVSVMCQMRKMTELIEQGANCQPQHDPTETDRSTVTIRPPDMTRVELKNAIAEVFAEYVSSSGLCVARKTVGPTIHEPVVAPPAPQTQPPQHVRTWGSGIHTFPEKFTVPRGSVGHLWTLWCCGNRFEKYSALKYLTPNDLPSKNARKRLSDLRFIVRKIQTAAEAMGLSISNIDEEGAAAVLAECSAAVKVPNATKKNRERRTSQLSWLSAVTLLRIFFSLKQIILVSYCSKQMISICNP